METIQKYINHPNIIEIRNQCKSRTNFSFTEVDKKEVKHPFLERDVNKVSQSSDISLSIVKENIHVFSHFPCASFNSSIKSTKFLNFPKYLKSVSLHKCPNFLKNVFPKYQCGFQKSFSAQQCFITMLEKWKKSGFKGKAFGVLMTDLSKAFDYLHH